MTAPLLLALLLLLLSATRWGPGHHLEFAMRIHRRRSELVGARVAKLLAEQRRAYDYGNIAADIINFKSYGGEYSHCHRWSIIEKMRESADTPRKEAFILGYLSHLAADTIAHNHYVPFHLARFARTKGLGHLYWEMAADRFIPEARWSEITRLKATEELAELDDLVNRAVPKKALSMVTNKLIFNHVLLVSERDSWRRNMERLHPIGKVKLEKRFLARFQKAAVERIRLALRPKGFALIQEIDANGKAAQARAMKVRERIATRWRPGKLRAEESARLAAPFLEGMESPPRKPSAAPKPSTGRRAKKSKAAKRKRRAKAR